QDLNDLFPQSDSPDEFRRTDQQRHNGANDSQNTQRRTESQIVGGVVLCLFLYLWFKGVPWSYQCILFVIVGSLTNYFMSNRGNSTWGPRQTRNQIVGCFIWCVLLFLWFQGVTLSYLGIVFVLLSCLVSALWPSPRE
ncbi:unnamed protein product, partial [Aphanomyces euteiches]